MTEKSAVTKLTAPTVLKGGARSAEETGWSTFSDFWGALRFRQKSLIDALHQVAFLSCADVISQDISKVPMRMYEILPGNKGKRLVEPKDHWMARKLALEPNLEHTWDEFWFMVVFFLCTTQNSFVAKRVNRIGEILDFIPLMSTSVTTHVDATDRGRGVKRYFGVNKSGDYEAMMLRDFGDYISDEDMIHFRGRLFDGLNGLSSLSIGNDALELNEFLNDFMTRTYKNDAKLRGVFQTDKTFENNSAFERLRRELKEAMDKLQKENFPIVLEDGLKFEAIQMDMTEAEIAKAKAVAIEDCCRLMRVPPHKIMHMNAVKYENLATIERTYVRDSLVPIARKVEQRFALASLTEEERLRYYFEFDREAMFFADPESQAKLHESYSKYAGMSINEGRLKRGQNPVEWGDVHPVPVQVAFWNPETGEFITSAGADPANGQDANLGGDGEGKSTESAFRVVEGGRN